MNRLVFTSAVPVGLLASAFAAMPLAAGAAAVVAGNLATTPVDESTPIVVAQLGGGGGAISLGPRISAQPVSATVGNGSGVGFSVGVLSSTGAPRFQWSGPAGAIPGATSATYSIAATTQAHQGNYSVRASDTRGTVVSSFGALQ